MKAASFCLSRQGGKEPLCMSAGGQPSLHSPTTPHASRTSCQGGPTNPNSRSWLNGQPPCGQQGSILHRPRGAPCASSFPLLPPFHNPYCVQARGLDWGSQNTEERVVKNLKRKKVTLEGKKVRKTKMVVSFRNQIKFKAPTLLNQERGVGRRETGLAW